MEGVGGCFVLGSLDGSAFGMEGCRTLSLCVSEMGTLSDSDQQTVAAVCGVIALFLSSPKSRSTRLLVNPSEPGSGNWCVIGGGFRVPPIRS